MMKPAASFYPDYPGATLPSPRAGSRPTNSAAGGKAVHQSPITNHQSPPRVSRPDSQPRRSPPQARPSGVPPPTKRTPAAPTVARTADFDQKLKDATEKLTDAYAALGRLARTQADAETDQRAVDAVPRLRDDARKKVEVLAVAVALLDRDRKSAEAGRRTEAEETADDAVLAKLSSALQDLDDNLSNLLSARPGPAPWKHYFFFLGPFVFLAQYIGSATFLSASAISSTAYLVAYTAAVGIRQTWVSTIIPGTRNSLRRGANFAVRAARRARQAELMFRHYDSGSLRSLHLPVKPWYRRVWDLRLLLASTPYSLEEIRESRNIAQPLDRVLEGQNLDERLAYKAYRLQQYLKRLHEARKAETDWAAAEEHLGQAKRKLEEKLQEQAGGERKAAELKSRRLAAEDLIQASEFGWDPEIPRGNLNEVNEKLKTEKEEQEERTRDVELLREEVTARAAELESGKRRVTDSQILAALFRERLDKVVELNKRFERSIPPQERAGAYESEYRRALRRQMLYRAYWKSAAARLKETRQRPAIVGGATAEQEAIRRSHLAEVQGRKEEYEFFKNLALRGRVALEAARKRVPASDRARIESSLQVEAGRGLSKPLELENRRLVLKRLRDQLAVSVSSAAEFERVNGLRNRQTEQIGRLQTEIRRLQSELGRDLGRETGVPLRQIGTKVFPFLGDEALRVLAIDGSEEGRFRFVENVKPPATVTPVEARLLLQEGFEQRPSAEQIELLRKAEEERLTDAKHRAEWDYARLITVEQDLGLVRHQLERRTHAGNAVSADNADPVMKAAGRAMLDYFADLNKPLRTARDNAQTEYTKATAALAEFRKQYDIRPKKPDENLYGPQHDLRSPEQRVAEARQAKEFAEKILAAVRDVPDPFLTRATVRRFASELSEHNHAIIENPQIGRPAEPVARDSSHPVLRGIAQHGPNFAFYILAALQARDAYRQGNIKEAAEHLTNVGILVGAAHLPAVAQKAFQKLAAARGAAESAASGIGRRAGFSTVLGLGGYFTVTSAIAAYQAYQASNQAEAGIKKLESETRSPANLKQLNTAWDLRAEATYAETANAVNTLAAGLATTSSALAIFGVGTRLAGWTGAGALALTVGTLASEAYSWWSGEAGPRQQGYKLLAGSNIIKPLYHGLPQIPRPAIESPAKPSPKEGQQSAPRTQTEPPTPRTTQRTTLAAPQAAPGIGAAALGGPAAAAWINRDIDGRSTTLAVDRANQRLQQLTAGISDERAKSNAVSV